MSKYRININGKTYEMEIEAIDENEAKSASQGAKNVDLGSGKTTSVEKTSGVGAAAGNKTTNAGTAATGSSNSAQPGSGNAAQSGSGANTVSSPMPGSITKIMVSEGQSVTAGQPVLILEAMKMENEITAPKDGVIGKLCVEAGQTVQGGAALFMID